MSNIDVPTDNAAISAQPTSRRLFVRDPLTNINFLVDSGAELSVIPKQFSNSALKADNSCHLIAANGSPIKSYGTSNLELSLGLRRTFSHIFVVADVTHPILGADFLHEHGLLLDIQQKRLFDTKTLRVNAIAHQIPNPEIPSIAARGNALFDDLLNKYPQLTRQT